MSKKQDRTKELKALETQLANFSAAYHEEDYQKQLVVISQMIDNLQGVKAKTAAIAGVGVLH